jgi:hypothetical protein
MVRQRMSTARHYMRECPDTERTSLDEQPLGSAERFSNHTSCGSDGDVTPDACASSRAGAQELAAGALARA